MGTMKVRWISLVLLAAIVAQPVQAAKLGQGAAVFAAQVKKFRAQVDSGELKAGQAIEGFNRALAESEVTADDVNEYAKSRLTPRAYREFSASIDQAMRGVDGESLSAEEVGSIASEYLSRQFSSGLSYAPCELYGLLATGLANGALGLALWAIVERKAHIGAGHRARNDLDQARRPLEDRIELLTAGDWNEAYQRKIAEYDYLMKADSHDGWGYWNYKSAQEALQADLKRYQENPNLIATDLRLAQEKLVKLPALSEWDGLVALAENQEKRLQKLRIFGAIGGAVGTWAVVQYGFTRCDSGDEAN